MQERSHTYDKIRAHKFFGISPSDMSIKSKTSLTENYSGLIEAIIVRAVKDYGDLKTKIRRSKSDMEKESIQEEISEIEDFFESKWFKILTGVNGAIYIPSLRNDSFRFAELYKKYNLQS